MADAEPQPEPITGRSGPWDPIAATFTCHRCGRAACTITLLPPGTPDPLVMQAPDAGSGPDAFRPFADVIRLSVDGPVRVTHHVVPGRPIDVDAIAAALRAGDVVALFALDTEYVPSWCPRCATHYCGDCWAVWVEMDEGFYDTTQGRCPEGHERMLDD